MNQQRRIAFLQSTSADSFAGEMHDTIERAINAGAGIEEVATALVAQVYGCGSYAFRLQPSQIRQALERAIERVNKNLPEELKPA